MIKQIGRYDVLKEAGQGGMSTVYEAFDPRFKRTVAIKVMTRELLHDETLKARFEREAQTIAALEHPAIVPVYDFGEDDKRPYLVMRLMTGGSLADRLEDGPMSIQDTAHILTRIGSALERAHEQGVIHRDLKPSNIMFDQYGDPYLADFGIARLTDAAVTLTGENVIGTPAYMSPEQVSGDHEIDGRSDIYALGVICFEMLTGRRPFQEKSPARLMMQHMLDPVPDIYEIRPDLPPGVDVVITRSMAKSPEERYAHAVDLTDTLDSLARIEPPAPAVSKAVQTGDVTQLETPSPAQGVERPSAAEIMGGDAVPPASGQTVLAPPGPEPTPAAAAGEEEQPTPGAGRRTGLIAVAAVAAILLLLVAAAAFWRNSLLPGGEEPAASGETAAGGEVVDENIDESAAGVSQARSETPSPQAADVNVRPTADALLERYYAAVDAGDHDAAAVAIDQAIALLPEEAAYHSEKAFLLESVGDHEGALAEMNQAVELDPAHGDYFAARGSLFRESGDLHAALDDHLRAVELSPQEVYAHLELAETYKQLDDLENALDQYNQAITINGDEAWIYGSRAELYVLLGEYDRALADIESARERDPDHQDDYISAADIFLYDIEEPQRAIDFYTLAVERLPDQAWTYAKRANALGVAGSADAALADLNRAIELDPRQSRYYIERANLYRYYLEDLPAALHDFNMAIELDPENPDAYAERASFYQFHGDDLEAALADRSHALDLEPEGPWRYVDRAAVLREMGREEEALADLDRCLELDEAYYWCSWERGQILAALGHEQQALEDFQRYLEQSPEDECPECRHDAARYIDENS